MRNTLATAAFAAALAIGGAACAADLTAPGLKDGPIYAPVVSWTGFYVGVGIGGGMVNHDIGLEVVDPALGELNGLGGEGIFGTVQIGYDAQFGGRFVAGIFADFDFTDISTKVTFGPFSASIDLNNMWSVGGRVGYLVNPDTLVYVLGAYTQAYFSAPKPITNTTFEGFSVGGGLETALGGNWFLKGEYRYTQLGRQTVFAVDGLTVTDQPDVQTGRVSIVYRFGHAYEPLK